MASRKLIATLLALGICNQAYAIDLPQEQKLIEQWRAERAERLTSSSGWLTLVGLYWLNEGENTFGHAETNALALNHPSLPSTLGSFKSQKGKVSFVVRSNSAVTHDGKRVQTIDMTPDTSGDPTTLSTGSLQFFVIERAGKLGVRVRDTQHPARVGFRGIDYFPISTDWVIDAKLEPYSPTRRIEIVNILGMTEQMISPGAIVFTKNGKQHRLDAVLEAPDDKELFIMFADQTNARESYGAGRFLYIPLPVNGQATIDFNMAYNPPCAFNDFATCPLPPRQNRLQMRVEAGEKKYVQAR